MIFNFRIFFVVVIISVFYTQINSSQETKLNFTCQDKNAQELSKPTNLPNISHCEDLFNMATATDDATQVCQSACGQQAASLKCVEGDSEYVIGCPIKLEPSTPSYLCHNQNKSLISITPIDPNKKDFKTCTELEEKFRDASKQAIETAMQEIQKQKPEPSEENITEIIKNASTTAYVGVCKNYCGNNVELIECNDGDMPHHISCIIN